MAEIINIQKFTNKELEDIAVAVKEELKRRKDATLEQLQENAVRALRDYFEAGGMLRNNGELICDCPNDIATYCINAIDC